MTFSLLSFFLGFLLLFASASDAHAAVYSGGGIQSGLSLFSGLGGISTATSVPQLIGIFVTFLMNIVLVIAVLAIIVAGIYLIVSNGDEGNKDKAKNIIFYVAIGIVLILFARVIVVSINAAFSS